MFSSDISEGYTTEDSEWSGSISSRCSSFGDVSVFGDDSPVRNVSRNWAVSCKHNLLYVCFSFDNAYFNQDDK